MYVLINFGLGYPLVQLDEGSFGFSGAQGLKHGDPKNPGLKLPSFMTLIFCFLQTSPSDGCILHFGRADADRLEQIKGITYSLQDFAGPPTWQNTPVKRNIVIDREEHPEVHERLPARTYARRLKQNEDNELFHCVIYLAPGDYHGYHAPTDWTVTHRRHFPGTLWDQGSILQRVVELMIKILWL